jgi:hypothetical protein
VLDKIERPLISLPGILMMFCQLIKEIDRGLSVDHFDP